MRISIAKVKLKLSKRGRQKDRKDGDRTLWERVQTLTVFPRHYALMIDPHSAFGHHRCALDKEPHDETVLHFVFVEEFRHGRCTGDIHVLSQTMRSPPANRAPYRRLPSFPSGPNW